MRDFKTGGRDPGADAAIRGARYADEGACVPWATMAAIERATRDAAERRAAAELGGQEPADAGRPGWRTIMGRMRHAFERLVSRG